MGLTVGVGGFQVHLVLKEETMKGSKVLVKTLFIGQQVHAQKQTPGCQLVLPNLLACQGETSLPPTRNRPEPQRQVQ